MVAVFKARFIFRLPAQAGGVRLIAMLGRFLAVEFHKVAGANFIGLDLQRLENLVLDAKFSRPNWSACSRRTPTLSSRTNVRCNTVTRLILAAASRA
jgi:hypothetical protein